MIPTSRTGPFQGAGMQIVAGVPLAVDEPADFRTFRIGPFGIDKLRDVDATLKQFTDVADRVL
jgi:aspartate aminotransferase-like enzyme